MLDDADSAAFRRDGWLVVQGALTAAQLEALDAAVARLEGWAESDGPGLHHFEQTDAGAVLAPTKIRPISTTTDWVMFATRTLTATAGTTTRKPAAALAVSVK
jgi:hypothetical protein